MLNVTEKRIMTAIVADCDEIEGWGFTRVGSMVNAAVDVIDGNYQRVGGYITDLIHKGLIEADLTSDEVWIAPEVFEAYC
jgi:hypothetical protein